MAQGPEQTAEQLAKVTERLERLARSQRGGPLAALKPFLLGALVGVGAALLYAPQTGEQTRALLRRNAGELRESTTQGAQSTKEKIQASTATAQDSVQATLTQVGDKVEAAANGRTQLRTASQEARQRVSEGGKAAQEAANAATDKAVAQSEEQERKAGRPNPKAV